MSRYMNTPVAVEEDTLRTLLQIVQGGPGEPTPAQRDSAIEDALEALNRWPTEVPGQMRLPV